ncbi:hypothetical protein V1264_024412 [Littorina saxatilis]|uniref:Tetraspanin n=2 Tax=Littorina saxatilis TaxID=31220 RepID=A0AAN9ALW8_9CAEN
MSVLVIVQAAVGGLFLAKNSALHSTIKEKVGDKVKDDYDETGNDVFSFAINMLNYLLKCCAINGRTDFKGGIPALSCCKREVITTDQNKCLARQSPYADFYQQGCYDKLKDKVLEQLTVAAVILALVLLLQVVEIVIALFVVKEASSIGPI